MPGLLVGIFGFQRSGKSLLAYLISEYYRKKGCIVYTNQKVDNFVTINSLEDIEINVNPKILWLDEAQYFLDSREWKNNVSGTTLFFNSIGKLNILLLLTGIHPGEIDLRLRRQMHYIIFTKSDLRYIYYRVYNNQNYNYKDFLIKKDEDLFKMLRYDTNYIPDYVEVSFDKFNRKVKSYNLK